MAAIASAIPLIVFTPCGSAAGGLEMLAPHRAVYDLELRKASERSGIQSMNGRIVYEITGNACDGMAVRYRFVTNVATADKSYQTDQQTATFESPDGKEFSFATRTFVDSRLQRTVIGKAVRTADGTRVDLTQPEKRELDLPEAVFISSHLVSIIDNALKGNRFVHHQIFDGSEEADEVVVGSGVIGEAGPYRDLIEGESEQAVSQLRDRKAWPVTVSYFDFDNSSSTERLPIYEASFILYADGVSRKLTMRYDDYSLSGHLTELEYLPPEQGCEKGE